MRQHPETINSFFVNKGEVVRITFQPANVPITPLSDKQRVHAVEGGKPLPKSTAAGSRTVTCRFTVTKAVGKRHTVIYECVFFTQSDPISAKYVIRAEGDGGPFRAGAATQILTSGELRFTVE